ncbi:uncharacterized mitochondrial protein AtMg00810-like [Telopea speciosissima]|uniref:uncharacterized mitochondrial protein AtMg00810-like n=1 Tax=Telopea speciosissima TaxID=54955 RepID=UPI001CC63B52|nr:uncharacterized mitochondrial protein AtMg00810-like [Telopea speciosissima]
MEAAKPMPTPCSTTNLTKNNGDLFPDPTLYRSIVGALHYLTLTRPDIAYSVNKVCQFMHSPTTEHWAAVKCLLRYIKDTLDHGIHLRVSQSILLNVYTDADWVGCPDDRRSTSGFCIYLGDNVISWSSKK